MNGAHLKAATAEQRDVARGGSPLAAARKLSTVFGSEGASVEVRVPPHDLDAEAAVLSAVMNDKMSFDKVAEFLEPEHFYSEAHRRIYEACVELARVGTTADIVTVAAWLRDHGRLPQVGGMAYLTTVLNAAPALSTVGNYVEIVRRKAQARAVVLLGQRITAQGYSGVDADGLVENAARELEELRAARLEAPRATPTPDDPLRGLERLASIAVVGRDRLVELAERPVVWLWDDIATAGLTILLAAGPGSGKTTLLFLLATARASRGAAVRVLGREVSPAPPGRYIVVIENEHSDESAARILRKSCRLQGIDEAALDAFILVARGNVRIGSDVWGDVERLIAAGLVSDIILDTLARCSPVGADPNAEQEQVEVFARIAQAIERAPTADARPTVWTAAHTRKVEGLPSLDDVSGSTQRAGQADVVILMGAQRTGNRVTSVKVAFGKVREKDAEDWPEPVEYTVRRDRVVLLDAQEDDERPLEDRILGRLAAGPQTKTALADKLGRSRADLEPAITALFDTRRIRTTEISVRGRTHKAFALAESTPQETP